MGRNPYNQTIHYERQQPQSTRHLGRMERRKDFLKRARKQKLKKETTLLLKRRAAMRNPDEFNTKMINLRLKGKALISTKPTEELSVKEIERQLLIQNNALERLQKKERFGTGDRTRIIYDDNGKAKKVDMASLIDANLASNDGSIVTSLTIKQARDKQIADLKRQIKQTQKLLSEAKKKERSQDTRKKVEVTNEYGEVVDNIYQFKRSK